MNFDQNATGFINRAIANGGRVLVFTNYEIVQLKNFYVPWDCDNVGDLAQDRRNSEHNWAEKSSKFEYFKRRYLLKPDQDITIFAEKIDGGPILILDGVHRAVGLQKAINEEPTLNEKANLIVVLFVIQTPDCDYSKLCSTPNLNT